MFGIALEHPLKEPKCRDRSELRFSREQEDLFSKACSLYVKFIDLHELNGAESNDSRGNW